MIGEVFSLDFFAFARSIVCMFIGIKTTEKARLPFSGFGLVLLARIGVELGTL